MEDLATITQTKLATTDHPALKNSQNDPPANQKKQEVTSDLRKYILLLASLAATVTYAAGFSPPGGVWQDTAADHLAGDPIIRDTHHRRYVVFFYCNATAFAASLVVIVIILILAYLEDKQQEPNSKGDKAEDKQQEPNSEGDKAEDKQQEPNSNGDKVETNSKVSCFLLDDKKKHRIALWTLQLVMVVDLLSLMGAYAAGTCRNTFTTVYSSVLVGFVFLYLVRQMVVAARTVEVEEAPATTPTPDQNKIAALASVPAGNNPQFSSGSVLNKVEQDVGSSAGDPEPEAVEKGEERQKPKQWIRFRSKGRMVGIVKFGIVHNKVKQDHQANNVRFRKVLMLLATFAVSITYSAGLSTPGGFWDSTGVGHRPGDAILKDRHNTRLSVFFGFNTMSFVSSLLIIVVLLDTKLRKINAYVFIVVALLSLIGAYNAGSCRQTDTTVYVFSLIAAVLLCILFLLWVTRAVKSEEPLTPSTPAVPQQAMGASDDGRKNANSSESKREKEKSAADKARSLVLLLATLAATITYQAGLDPPGGAWQDNNGGHMAGDPILLTTNHKRYKAFFYCNSVSLVASLLAIVLVQMKFLLEHHVLEAVMILDLFGLIGAYAAGSCRDVNTSVHAMALAGAVLVYVVIHVIFFTLDDGTRKRSESAEKRKNKLVEKTRKRLLLFAILVATITYQAGLTPPGGFLLQDDQSGNHAGDPVLLYNFPRRYKAFFYCNSVSFMLSIALILLLVNPKLYRPAIRTHALSVCTAVGLFGLMGAYAAGSTQHIKTSIYIFVLVAVVIFFIMLLFLVFWFTGCRTKVEEGSSKNSTTQQGAAVETNTQVPLTATSNNNTSTGTSQGSGMETDKKKRVHAKRKYLMLLGILVASVTYQAGLEPPGGAWQSSSGGYEPGNPVMHDNRRPRYLAFFYSNSTSFMASIVVILLLLVPKKKLFENKTWHKSWLVVMNTTIVLDLLGLLGAYAAGSSRRWKTSVYVLLLVIGVLAYMVFHFAVSCIIKERNHRSSQQHVDSEAQR